MIVLTFTIMVALYLDKKTSSYYARRNQVLTDDVEILFQNSK
jgi:hypothetical protein